MEDTHSLIRHLYLQQWQRLLKLAIPCRCKVCSKTSTELICPPCLASLPRSDLRQHCLQCGSALPEALNKGAKTITRCGACLTTKPPFDATLFPFYYTEPIAGLIQRFKFNNDLILTKWFAQAIVEQLIESTPTNALLDCLIPVPLHPDRLRQRGYNQSYILAKHIGALLDIPVYKNVIIRQRDTPKQSGLNKQQRQRNLQGAFCLAKGTRARLQGQRIAIMDDVITTGSTLLAVAKNLNNIKAAHICLLAIAKTNPNTFPVHMLHTETKC